MQSIILLIHLMVAVAMIGVVLLQRSEGGALGIGGGGGGGGFGGLMTGRGAANVLTRVTAVLAAIFFSTSIILTVFGQSGGGSVLDAIDVNSAGGGAVQSPLPLGEERAASPADAEPAAPSEPTVPLSQ